MPCRYALITLALTGMTLCAACDKPADADGQQQASAKQSKKNGNGKHNGNGNGKHNGHDGKHDGDEQKFKAGRLDKKEIPESSGVIASRKYAGVFWTINDSGNGPTLFAFGRDGHLLAEFPVNVRNNDWEAVTADDEGHLFIGDIGNNAHDRDRVIVYRLAEPDPTQKQPRSAAAPLRVSGMWRLKYPGQPFDAESLFVHQGRGYVISKLLNGKNAGLYSFDLAPQQDAATLEPVCDLPIRSPVTDAALSVDGDRLAVMTVTGPYLFTGLGGDLAGAAKIEPAHVTYFDPRDLNMEGVCFVEGGLLATTEDGQILFFAEKYFK